MIKFGMFILVILITYDSIPFIFKYVQIRLQKLRTKANIVSIKHSTKGRSGMIPLVSYKINGDDYKEITPIYSTFTSFIGNKIKIGLEIDVFYNSKKPYECILTRDFNVILQAAFLITIYILFILTLFNHVNL